MKEIKKFLTSGLSSGIGYLDKLFKWGEEYDMERLSLEAKKGYIVEKLGITSSSQDYEPINLGRLVLLLNGFGLVLVTFTILPFFNYWGRVNQLEKGNKS